MASSSSDEEVEKFVPRSEAAVKENREHKDKKKKKKKGCCGKAEKEEEEEYRPAPPPPPPPKKVKPSCPPCRGPGKLVCDDGEDDKRMMEPYTEALSGIFPQDQCIDGMEMPWNDLLINRNVRLWPEPKSDRPRVPRIEPDPCCPEMIMCLCDEPAKEEAALSEKVTTNNRTEFVLNKTTTVKRVFRISFTFTLSDSALS